MPAFPYLFRKGSGKKGEVVVNVPDKFKRPNAGTIVATRDALDLVEYLKGLDHSYPIEVDVADAGATQ